MRILVIRLLAFGDVACVGLPAVRMLRRRHPEASFSFMTYAVGGELARLEPGLEKVLVVPREDYPAGFVPAAQAFLRWGGEILREKFDLVYNFDTWFMPCFMARFLKDNGVPFQGNHMRWPLKEFYAMAEAGTLTNDHVLNSGLYLESTFPRMRDWGIGWWERHPTPEGYPKHYLSHCCGLEGPFELGLDVPADEAFRAGAQGRKILGLATVARKLERTYPFGPELQKALEDAGYFVWTEVGTLPVRETLARLRASDALITVASAPQWLARNVACPVILIPGPLPPAHLGEKTAVPRLLDCQYCGESTCAKGLDFACIRTPVAEVVRTVREFFTAHP